MNPGRPQADIANPWSLFDYARCFNLYSLVMVGGENVPEKAHSASAE